ncbi:hypothetical protein EZV61_19325 [Corallincola luteus]|uniref:Uncharacterized protein n=1 Tax=Corallincola luteus TaxID=1775177 RepID=A0ABY2AFA0_9GAMM|nr:hypothetical protein [Corallincola luteus]TCI01069.1 hypothetical protein EZV61_19325 [Corallincola luteus]
MTDPFDRSIPGYTELKGWPKPPVYPESISEICLYRDGTVVVSIQGSMDFFFEPNLGRLCYGDSHKADNAAFIKKGSHFESELYSYFETARKKLSIEEFSLSDIKLFNKCFKRAKVYSGV